MVLDTLNNNNYSEDVDYNRIVEKDTQTEKIGFEKAFPETLNDIKLNGIRRDAAEGNVQLVSEQNVDDEDEDEVVVHGDEEFISDIVVNAMVSAVEMVNLIHFENMKLIKKKLKKRKKEIYRRRYEKYMRIAIVEPQVDANYPDLMFGNFSTIERLNAMQRVVARRVRREMLLLSDDLVNTYKTKCDLERMKLSEEIVSDENE